MRGLYVIPERTGKRSVYRLKPEAGSDCHLCVAQLPAMSQAICLSSQSRWPGRTVGVDMVTMSVANQVLHCSCKEMNAIKLQLALDRVQRVYSTL